MLTESSTGSEDWEQDFDIELTEEDIKAAEEVARKLNVSSKDYTKITGEQVKTNNHMIKERYKFKLSLYIVTSIKLTPGASCSKLTSLANVLLKFKT